MSKTLKYIKIASIWFISCIHEIPWPSNAATEVTLLGADWDQARILLPDVYSTSLLVYLVIEITHI